MAEEVGAELGGELAKQLGEGELPSREEVEAAMQRAYLAINERLKPMQVACRRRGRRKADRQAGR